MNQSNIDALVRSYATALSAEAHVQQHAVLMKQEVELHAARIVQGGYDAEAISGSNQAARDRAELIYLENDRIYRDLRNLAQEAALDAALATVRRKAIEMRCNLYMAN